MLHFLTPAGPSLGMQEQFGVDPRRSSAPTVQDWNRLDNYTQIDARIQITLNAIRAIARHAAGYPGRKKLVWVSSAFPINILPDPSEPLRQSTVGRAHSVGEELRNQSSSELSFDATMEEFASQTGGETCTASNNLAACLQSALGNGLSYYEIGYYPPIDSWKEGFHRIVGSSHHSGVRLWYRRGYYAETQRAVAPRGAETARNADAGLKQAACDDVMTATALTLTVRPLVSETNNDIDYSVTVDGNTVTGVALPEHPQSVHLGLDFAACVFDAAGKPHEYMLYPAEQELSQEEYASLKQRGLHRVFELRPISGVAQVRWLVRDRLTGALGSVDVPYQSTPALTSKTGPAANDNTNKPIDKDDKDNEPLEHTVSPVVSMRENQVEEVVQDSKVSADVVTRPEIDGPENELESYCEAIGKATKETLALTKVCEFSLSLSRHVPNLICERRTKRFWRANGFPAQDVVTSKVLFLNGIEHERHCRRRIEGASLSRSDWQHYLGRRVFRLLTSDFLTRE